MRTSIQPVDSLTHSIAERALKRWRLDLPTEAQWIYAALDGYLRGEHLRLDPRNSSQYGNLGGPAIDPATLCERETSRMNTYSGPAPVGILAPTVFGLFDVWGNVSELCADYLVLEQTAANLDPDARFGRRQIGDSPARVLRGGSFLRPIDESVFATNRPSALLLLMHVLPSAADLDEAPEHDVGVRPVMNMDHIANHESD